MAAPERRATRHARLLFTLSFPIVLAGSAAAQDGVASPRAGDETAQWLDAGLHWTTRAIEVTGILVIVIGAVLATGYYLSQTVREGPHESHYHRFRSTLGRSILLGLEFLVAADIIATVAIDPSLESVAVLAGIVLVRTFLSLTLEVEIDGRWPWQQKGRD